MWKYQLKVVLWKNLIIRQRHWFLTLCEASIPALLFLLVAFGRSKISSLSKQQIVNVTYHDKFPIDYGVQGFNMEETRLFYCPSNPYFDDLIHRVQEKFQLINNNKLSFDNEQELLEAYAKNSNGTVIAIVFHSKQGSKQVDYTVRHHNGHFSWKTDQLYKNEYLFAPSEGSDYVWQGFLTLQKAVDMSFIEKEKEQQGGRLPELTIDSLEFPYPPYKLDNGISGIFIHYLPLITLFSFIFVCPAVLKRVVEEKYSGIKELMKMIGMKAWMLWLGWFIYSILPMILSVCLIVFIMKVDLFQASYPAIEHTSAGVLMVFLLLYCSAVTVYCFFLGTLFYKPILATLVGLLLWILSYFLPKYLIDENSGLSFTSNILLMLLPNMGLHFGYMAVSHYEIREIGVQWTNWHLPGGNGPNEVTMLNVCLMLILDSVIYMLLALYIDGINPGKYGVPKSFLFPFKELFSCLRPRNNVEVGDSVESLHMVESGLGAPSCAIKLVNVFKKYGQKTVVRDLSMDILENEITILLGHNGAGKSTTMGMITGMIRNTSGHILINGKEINSSSDVTESIGLCTQHNLFFPDLTVSEHLKFFALLKGKTCTEAEIELNILLETLHLEEKRNDLAHTLSGGMKRKLCLGMAIIGGSKILILDEPSSGMDPQSRRDMWDLLLQWRHSRTILITTHFMEEADALGDRIAIMNEGVLMCIDTPMKLKKKYDTGYNLNLLIKDGEDVKKAVDILKAEISQHIRNLQLKGVNGYQVEFLLPFGNNYIEMFEHLESKKDEFKVESISFTQTTLEDVFLHSKTSNAKDEVDNTSIKESINCCGSGRYRLTSKALFYKRYRFITRKFLTYIIPSGIAVAFLVLCIFMGQESSYLSSGGGPPLKLSLTTYGKSKVFLNATENPDVLSMAKFYKNLIDRDKSDLNTVSDVSEAIIKEGVSNLPFYRHHMIASAELKQRNYGTKTYFEATAFYNNLAQHSAPISLNLITNSFAKLVLGVDYSISTTNHPLHNINSVATAAELSEIQIGLLWLMILPLGFLFFLGSFIYFPYVELSTKFTQLQFMTGLNPAFYWMTTFLCDIIIYTVFALFMSIISLGWTPFHGTQEFRALLMILIFYGIAGIPCSYLFGRRKSFSGAYALFIIIGIMLGVLLTTLVMALQESGDDDYVYKGKVLSVVFLIVCPQFGLTYLGVLFSRKVITNYNFNHMERLKLLSVCSREEASPCCFGPGPACDNYQSYMNILQPQIYYMLLGAVCFLLLNFFLDCYWSKKLANSLGNLFNRCQRNKAIQDNSGAPDQTLRVKKLKKSYSGRQVVNDINLDVGKGACMGILGVNGAGKTTTFKMLTREEVKDNGIIKIDKFNIEESQYLTKLGYCPQNDALNFSLTGRDILKTMAMLRGIENENDLVSQFLNLFGLIEIADIPCEQYSGGNKRKLSFAVAVIGFPEFILLDEPTSGVDPISRRKFWSLIKQIREEKKKSFILTSHSMAECEAVCNDLIIMKQGSIEKQGTISKLKKEISGFNIRLKLKQGPKGGNDEVDGVEQPSIKTIEDLKGYLIRVYPKGEFRDEHSGLIHFYIKDKDKKWSELFKQFENLKNDSPELIEDYSISEASLEDVFLAVAKPDEAEEQKFRLD